MIAIGRTRRQLATDVSDQESLYESANRILSSPYVSLQDNSQAIDNTGDVQAAGAIEPAPQIEPAPAILPSNAVTEKNRAASKRQGIACLTTLVLIHRVPSSIQTILRRMQAIKVFVVSFIQFVASRRFGKVQKEFGQGRGRF